MTERSFPSSVSETIYHRRLQLSDWRHTRRDRGELGILHRASVLLPSTCTKGPRMQAAVPAVMTCSITNTTTGWSVMQFRADPVPIFAGLIALRSGWSGDADTAKIVAEVLLLLILMMEIIDHWHIPTGLSSSVHDISFTSTRVRIQLAISCCLRTDTLNLA